MPSRSEQLTPRQHEILDFIRSTLESEGRPPTRAEVCAAFGFRSPNAAESHLRALAAKGAILLEEGRARGIRLAEGLGLPVIGRVAAGSPILSAEHVESRLQLDPAMFASRPDYLLRVRGLSMRDAGILEGDLLAVRRASEAHNGQIVVARINDEVTVKSWQLDQGHLSLLPANADYAPILVDPEQDDFHLEGIMVGLIRSHSN